MAQARFDDAEGVLQEALDKVLVLQSFTGIRDAGYTADSDSVQILWGWKQMLQESRGVEAGVARLRGDAEVKTHRTPMLLLLCCRSKKNQQLFFVNSSTMTVK